MKRVLITGASGNVGLEVIRSLITYSNSIDIVAGLRNPENDRSKFDSQNVEVLKFDFEDPATFLGALNNTDILFLLRPPQITNIDCFKPLVEAAKKSNIRHIVFLSVQGVEKSNIIPHHKIEKLIKESKIPYTFLRPAYFMQNFTTTLQKDLVQHQRTYLPAGDIKFTLVDVRDIGSFAAHVICNNTDHINMAYELTCTEKLSFEEMANKMTAVFGISIKYISPNLLAFYLNKRKENMPTGLILVMIMLHYLPRFQKKAQISNSFKLIASRMPITFDKFLVDFKHLMIKQ